MFYNLLNAHEVIRVRSLRTALPNKHKTPKTPENKKKQTDGQRVSFISATDAFITSADGLKVISKKQMFVLIMFQRSVITHSLWNSCVSSIHHEETHFKSNPAFSLAERLVPFRMGIHTVSGKTLWGISSA